MARRKKKDNLKLLAFIFSVLVVLTYNYFNDETPSVSNANPSPINENINEDINEELTIYYFDVGQADSILISNENTHMLIDAGNDEDGKHLVDYIQNELGITKLDYVVGTHPHEDHIGGIDDIIDAFDIDNVLMPDVITTTKTYEDVLDSISSKKLQITVPKIGDIISLGAGSFEVIYTGTDEKDLNSSSIILKLTFGNTSYLFTGDTTSEVEKTILDKNIQADVLKVAHHGSAYSSSNQFLLRVKPKYAIISVAEKNTYNHPSKETLNRLKKFTDKIYITSEMGTIKLTSNGEDINITSIKTNTNG